MSTVKPRCPICRKEALPREANKAFPFCTERCRWIDVGNWLGGGYRIGGAEEEDLTSLPSSDETGDDEKLH